MSKKKKEKKQFIDSKEFFNLLDSFIHANEKKNRLQKNGLPIKSQSVYNYTYLKRLLSKFSIEKNFEPKLYLVNNLNKREFEKAKKQSQLFYLKFTDYLYDELNLFDSYVGSNIKLYRAFLNYLIQEKNLQIGDFHKSYYVCKPDIPIITLSPEQLNYLIFNPELSLKLSPALQLIKDLFVFGCTVALRVSDLLNLQAQHIIQQNGQFYIKVKSIKTNTYTSIKLPQYAIDILTKYQKKNRTLIFPEITIAHFNRKLKELGQLLDYSEAIIKTREKRGVPVVIYKNTKTKTHYTLGDHLTTHTMRRTAITNMLQLGMPEHMVRKISGHAANSREFFKYVQYAQNHIDEHTEHFFEKLSHAS